MYPMPFRAFLKDAMEHHAHSISTRRVYDQEATTKSNYSCPRAEFVRVSAWSGEIRSAKPCDEYYAKLDAIWRGALHSQSVQ